MKLNPKYILGSVLIFTFLTTLLFLKLSSRQTPSSLNLNYEQNRFKLGFNINESNQQNFKSFLQNLSIVDGIVDEALTFELDSTSSARLALMAPINANLDIGQERINFSGKISQKMTTKDLFSDRIEVPRNAELLLFSENIMPFGLTRLNIGEQNEKLVTEALNPDPGSYFVSFNSGQDFALYFKSGKNIEGMNIFQLEATQNSSSQTKIYQMKFTAESPDEIEVAPVIFEAGNSKIFASSLQIAQDIINANGTKTFPEGDSKVDFAIRFEPQHNFDSNRFIAFLTQEGIYNESLKEGLIKSLSKIQRAQLSLKGTDFSGLIILK